MQHVSHGAVTLIVGRTPTDPNALLIRPTLSTFSGQVTRRSWVVSWRTSQPAAGQRANGQPLDQDREHHDHVGRRQDHLPPGNAISRRLAR